MNLISLIQIKNHTKFSWKLWTCCTVCVEVCRSWENDATSTSNCSFNFLRRPFSQDNHLSIRHVNTCILIICSIEELLARIQNNISFTKSHDHILIGLQCAHVHWNHSEKQDSANLNPTPTFRIRNNPFSSASWLPKPHCECKRFSSHSSAPVWTRVPCGHQRNHPKHAETPFLK